MNKGLIRSFGVLFVVMFLACSLCGCKDSPSSPTQSESTSVESAQSTVTQMRPNDANFGQLFTDLVTAYESPSDQANQAVQNDVATISSVNQQDGEVAQSIASHWNSVYVDKSYQLCMYAGGEYADELSQTGLADSPTHAFVVLGYELKNGEMTDELKGRCDAAAAAARSYPQSFLVVSGGATGKNNPEGHTEAGLMRSYLVEECGIDESRILSDENARTTAENALNTMRMLKQSGMQTMTIITSSYHQRWGQAIYNLVATLYRLEQGYGVGIVGNYCYDVAPSNPRYKQDDRIAVTQMAQILGLPQEILKTLPSVQ